MPDYPIREQEFLVGDRKLSVRGAKLKEGATAPDFKLIANDLSFKSLSDYAGKVKIISVVPSLDTSVCHDQTIRFNEEAANLGDDVVILTVSADLPFAQKRWCGAQGIEAVETLSTHRDMQFADDYGVHVVDIRMTQRAIIVLDRNNQVVYTEYVPIIGTQVNFTNALEAARQVVN